ncbi:MAG: DNA polymerase III subunit gamma/tau [Planctomycetes bacterium]|nr:DNA polymerase III subunit gamma/tau [Planctomycetota bacterium]
MLPSVPCRLTEAVAIAILHPPLPVEGAMSYTVLARRYRSKTFDEVIGQEPISRTLQRAIESERTAHAYLFSGTRGVGKTSMARIFAKALNVNDSLTDADEIAAAIMAGNDIDVIEIDGASNRGVDDARELISNSIYMPARCPYKIYIIDEVHMLTKEAFNALLKTMEEPPAHVKFILCTTEPARVPATIQSRCQRFDFRAIPTARITDHLKQVLTSEGIKADGQVIEQVARLGNGSMRDALSLLDRLIATGDKQLTAEHLQQMLGLPDQEVIESLVDAIVQSDAAATLQRAGELLDRGVSIDQVLESIILHTRNLLLITVGADKGDDGPGLLELTSDRIAQLKNQAEQFDAPTLVHMIVLLENVQRNGKYSATAARCSRRPWSGWPWLPGLSMQPPAGRHLEKKSPDSRPAT